jgi:hypothetical protein
MAHVTLTGTDFGHKQGFQCGDYKVQMQEGDNWVDLPVIVWTDTLIEWALPPHLFTSYEYHRVRVETPTGISNEREYYVLPSPMIDRIEDNTGKDAVGPPAGWLTVYSRLDASQPFGNQGTFSDMGEKWYEDTLGGMCSNFFGAIYVVTLTSLNDRFCVQVYDKWNASGNKDSFKAKLENPWRDDDGDFFKDDDEPICPSMDCVIPPGPYSVQVCVIIYADSNGHGGFSGDKDTIYQVVKSESDMIYNINIDPLIVRLDPRQIQPGQLLKIFGINFGSSQGDTEVRVGGTTVASDPNLGLGYNLQTAGGGFRQVDWRDTRIRLYMPTNTVYYDNRIVCIWVEKNGTKSNYNKIQLVQP